MKKFVIKTAVITLISIIVAMLLLLVGITVIKPSVMSDFFYDMGNDRLSAWYTELSYQKMGSVKDLNKVIYRADEAKDYKLLEKYCKELTERQDFDDICSAEANGYKNYVFGKYVIAMYKNQKTFEDIIAVADKTLDNGYTEDNAYRSLLYGAGILGDTQFINAIKDKFAEMNYENQIFTEDKTYLQDLT